MTIVTKAKVRAALDRAMALGDDLAQACVVVAQALSIPVEAVQEVAAEVEGAA